MASLGPNELMLDVKKEVNLPAAEIRIFWEKKATFGADALASYITSSSTAMVLVM